MNKPQLPTDILPLLGIYQAALNDVPDGATEKSAMAAAKAILERFAPHPQQAQRWLLRGLAMEIIEATEPEDEEEDDE
jgi:hypothetical protein